MIVDKVPLLPLHYFGNLHYYSLIFKYGGCVFDGKENYVKQTFRTRCAILGSNGPLSLVIPVVKKSGVKQKMEDILISHEENWMKIHWKSITSAYRTSPYFEFYEPELEKLFTTKEEKLIDFSIKAHRFILDNLNLNIPFHLSTKYIVIKELEEDFRKTLSPKTHSSPQVLKERSYIQVFSDRFSFCPNLSILDLLFNEGPNTVSYLDKIAQKI